MNNKRLYTAQIQKAKQDLVIVSRNSGLQEFVKNIKYPPNQSDKKTVNKKNRTHPVLRVNQKIFTPATIQNTIQDKYSRKYGFMIIY